MNSPKLKDNPKNIVQGSCNGPQCFHVAEDDSNGGNTVNITEIW